MSAPEVPPRGNVRGVVAVWLAAAVIGLVVGFAVPTELRATWFVIGLGGTVILAFVVQLIIGRSKGFIDRVAASTVGALLVMGVVAAGFGLAVLASG